MAWIIENSSGDILGVYATQELAIADADKSGSYIELTTAELESRQREWRNSELFRTDPIVAIHDHSKRASFIAYRQLLRDWPSTSDFPGTRPVRT